MRLQSGRRQGNLNGEGCDVLPTEGKKMIAEQITDTAQEGFLKAPGRTQKQRQMGARLQSSSNSGIFSKSLTLE